VLRMNAPGGDLGKVLDEKSHWVDYEDILREHREDLILAANCHEARQAVSLARQASTTMAPPAPSQAKWARIASFPIGYVLRRQIETGDPDYWNHPENVLRETLAKPDWAALPLDVVRGELENYLPKGKKII